MAMNNFSAKLSGGTEIAAQLRLLGAQEGKKATAKALRNAAKLVKDAAVSNVMQYDDATTQNKIYKNIAIRAMTKRKLRQRGGTDEYAVGVSIGVLGGAMSYADSKNNRRLKRAGEMYPTLGSSNNPGGDTWYWRFLELGTKRTRAKPFLRPAFDNNTMQLLDNIVADLNEQFAKALQK